MIKIANSRHHTEDLEFMQSLGAAVLQQSPKRLHSILLFWLFTIIALITWMSLAEIDEITRGSGEIVPSGENQMLQNLEGGIISEILIKPGDHVEAGQVLLKIDNQESISGLKSSNISSQALTAKIIRLEAQAQGKDFNAIQSSHELKLQDEAGLNFLAIERSLFESHQHQYHGAIAVLNQQLSQGRQQLQEARSQISHLKTARGYIVQEVKMAEPLVKKGIKPKVEFLKLQREASELEREYQSLILSVPRHQSKIAELKQKIKQHQYQFRIEAKQELAEVSAQLSRIQSTQVSLADQVQRTLVRSPTKGVVQSLFVHTVGGVVKPGQDLLELVPLDDTLLVEIRVKPADIAFIYPEQNATVKFSAYDFSIYGGLTGKVTQISADTIKDERGETFYTLRILTDKNHLGSAQQALKIIPGMTVTVDIITGRKTVLDYILKPIIKTKTYTFSER